MKTRSDTIHVDGSPMRVFLALPDGPGPHPAVVVMCHIEGVDEFTRDRCERLAAEGFIAAAPDVFHYHPWIADNNERRASLRDTSIVADIQACLDHLTATTAVDPARLGIIGHCLGGRLALLGAGCLPNLSALAMYYGGRTMIAWGEQEPSPFDRIQNIKGSVIGFFGNLDKSPSPEDVDAIEVEMKRNRIPVEFHRYDGAGHAFQDFTAPSRFHAPSAADSWEKTLRFFRKALLQVADPNLH